MRLGWLATEELQLHLDTLAKELGVYVCEYPGDGHGSREHLGLEQVYGPFSEEELQEMHDIMNSADDSDDEGCSDSASYGGRPLAFRYGTACSLGNKARTDLVRTGALPQKLKKADILTAGFVQSDGHRQMFAVSICTNRNVEQVPLQLVAWAKEFFRIDEDPRWYVDAEYAYEMELELKSL